MGGAGVAGGGGSATMGGAGVAGGGGSATTGRTGAEAGGESGTVASAGGAGGIGAETASRSTRSGPSNAQTQSATPAAMAIGYFANSNNCLTAAMMLDDLKYATGAKTDGPRGRVKINIADGGT
jgi:hypothetical protein